MKGIKFVLSLFIFAAVTAASVFADGEKITIKVNGGIVESENAPVIIDGTTFVPLRPVTEAMGCVVAWDGETKTANIALPDTAVTLQIGNKKICVYDISDNSASLRDEIQSDKLPIIINDSVYIPLRVTAEAFDAEVNWDGESKTVEIFTQKYSEDENNIIYEAADNKTLILKGKGEIYGQNIYIEYEHIVIDYGITGIGDFSFSLCSNLKDISIPDSITKIGASAFWGCINLSKAVIPYGTESIGECAFWECSSLKEISIPNTVKTIGNDAFAGCTGLKKVVCTKGSAADNAALYPAEVTFIYD